MKRIGSIFLCALLLLALCACGGATDSAAGTAATVNVTESPAAETKAPAATEAPDATEAPAETETPASPAETDAPTATEPPVAAEAPAAEPAQPEAAAAQPDPQLSAEEAKALAEGCVDQPVSALYAAIGAPSGSDYAPSCLDESGEDGELYYDGFVVYTFRSAEGETVTYVE